jgi:hypothetical protein
MSASEQAQADAKDLDLGNFTPSEDGSIHTGANREFIRAFVGKLPASERGGLMLPDGTLSQEGVNRIRNAVFAKAYGDSETGLQVIQRMAESTDNNVKRITAALLQNAPGFADLKEGVSQGSRFGGLDITGDISKAVEKFSSLREQGLPVAEYLKQQALFGEDMTPFQKRLLTILDFHKNSAKALSSILNNYVRLANALGDPNQTALFGEPVDQNGPTLFHEAVLEYERGNELQATTQISLLDSDQGRTVQSETGDSSPVSVSQPNEGTGTESETPAGEPETVPAETPKSKLADNGLTQAEVATQLNRFTKSGDLHRYHRRIVNLTRGEKIRLAENLRAGDDPTEAIKDAKGYQAPEPDQTEKVASGEAGFVSSDVLTAPARIVKAAHDFVSVEPVPYLKKAGVSAEARAHAAARIAVPKVVNDLLAKVFPYSYTFPEEMSKTIDVLNKDNILDGYNTFLQRESEARKTGDDSTADRWRKRAENIGSPADIAKLYKEVTDAHDDPQMVANIERWKKYVNPALDDLYNKMKGVDPATTREGRGLVFGARINLLPESKAEEMKAFSDPEQPMPAPVTSNYRNPNAKRDPFDRAAKFTGEYSNDAAAVLTNVLGPRMNETTKLDFYNAIEKKGAGVILEPGDKGPAEIDGQRAVRLPIKMPVTNAEGRTTLAEKSLYVKQEIAREVRSVLNTDMRLEQNPVGKFLTQIQLAQFADMAAHLKNIHTVIANAPATKTVLGQIARKFPGVGTADFFQKIATISKQVVSDTPEIRSEIADMAKLGLVRPEYPMTGIQRVTRGQQVIHAVDTASRIAMNRFFTKLAAAGRVEDTPENRASFVSQIGEYNDRLMSPMMRMMKQSGLSPFVVAGRNFTRQGIRLLTGNPGLKAANSIEAVKFRTANLIGGMVAVGVVPAVLNTLTTGSVAGRPGTPIGAWDLGKPEDEKGKHRVVDFAQILGYRRGMRATGLNAAITGLQEGQSGNEILDHAISDVTSTAAHPWIGPALGFAYQTLTGSRLDLRGGPIPEEARNMGSGGNQYEENARVALKNQNPFLYQAISPFIGTNAENDDQPYYSRVLGGAFKSPATAVGITDVQSPAMKLAGDLLRQKGTGTTTPEKQDSKALAKSLIQRSKRGDDVQDEIQQALHDENISMQQLKILKGNDKLAPLALKIKYLSVMDAARVWERSTEDEKNEIRTIMVKKIVRGREKLSSSDRNYLRTVGLMK